MTQDQLRVWLNRLNGHAPGEAGHAERVAVYAVAMGERIGLDDDELSLLRFSAALHDIGKLAVPAEILTKSGRLSGEEVLEMRSHCERAVEFLPTAPELVTTIRSHHERWDGKGYPDGLAGSQVPPASRIIAIAEAFDAMTADARYRPPLTDTQAIDELKRGAGGQFDPAFVPVFESIQVLIQPVLATNPR